LCAAPSLTDIGWPQAAASRFGCYAWRFLPDGRDLLRLRSLPRRPRPFDLWKVDSRRSSPLLSVDIRRWRFALFFIRRIRQHILVPAMTTIRFSAACAAVHHRAVYLVPAPIWCFVKCWFVIFLLSVGARDLSALPSLRPLNAGSAGKVFLPFSLLFLVSERRRF